MGDSGRKPFEKIVRPFAAVLVDTQDGIPVDRQLRQDTVLEGTFTAAETSKQVSEPFGGVRREFHGIAETIPWLMRLRKGKEKGGPTL